MGIKFIETRKTTKTMARVYPIKAEMGMEAKMGIEACLAEVW